MRWSSDAGEHECYYGYGLGMGALWSSDAVEHERYYGLGMDALVIGCSAWQSSMMVVVFEVHGCTRGHYAHIWL